MDPIAAPPTTKRTSERKRKIFAVKRCSGFQGPAIFWSWDDCSSYVDHRTNKAQTVDFRECDDISSALEFIFARQPKEIPRQSMTHDAAIVGPSTHQKAVSVSATLQTFPPTKVPKLKHSVTVTPISTIKASNVIRKKTVSETRAWKFKANIERLQEYKAKYGNFNVTKKVESEPLSEVASFCRRSKREVKKYLMDPTTSSLTDIQFDTLESIGFVKEFVESSSSGIITPAKLKQWDDMLERVRKFQNQYQRLPTQRDDVELSQWINRQRKAISESAENDSKNSKLSTKQIIKLTSIHIHLSNKNKVDMNSRCNEWIQYWQTHGKEPPSRSDLGLWVTKTVEKYKMIKAGLKKRCNLTTEMIERLQTAGFMFPSEEDVIAYKLKYEQNQGAPPRKYQSWEASFQRLLLYKDSNGHTKVPRQEPHLGDWVHEQRKQYHNFQTGLKSSLTRERLGKLLSIGFAFSAGNWRERNEMEDRVSGTKGGGDDDDQYEDVQPQHYQQGGREHSVTGIAQEPAGLFSAFRQYHRQGEGA